MISYLEAIRMIHENMKPMPIEKIPLSLARGKICREHLRSSENIPPFDNSAMDGFALRSVDSNPSVTLQVVGSAAAGNIPEHEKEAVPMTSWEIMTGGPVPNGFDSVVKIEEVEVVRNHEGLPTQIKLQKKIPLGLNIRKCGEDFKKGQSVFENGTRLMPEHLMALASLGISEVSVSESPRVAVISTGSEVVPFETSSLSAGKIRNSTAPYLVSALQSLGAEPRYFGTVGDDVKEFFHTLDQVFEFAPDVIVTTGAVSMGRYDFIKTALHDLGAEIIFHKVAIRPGKPVLFAKLREMAFFGLPGNPVSGMVGLRFFVEPYLKVAMGAACEKTMKVRLKDNTKKPKGLRCFYRSKLEIDNNGQFVASVLPNQSSAIVSNVLEANAWVILDEDTEEVKESSFVQAVPLHSLDYNLVGMA